jgi:ATP-binding cassette subfamily F protein 3
MGCFLFGGDDIDKKIKVLSGGEKARVALAKTIVSKANFLLLDEPTNHLDMHSVELLVEALNKYEGSFILVSHDRYFVSKTANKIWEIDNYEIKEFNGGYDEWMEWKERQAANVAVGDKKVEKVEKVERVEKNIEAIAPVKPKQQTLQPIDKELKKELQKHKNRFAQLEDIIAVVSKTKADLETKLGQPDILADRTKFVVAEKAYNDAVLELTILNGEYETVFEKVMELEEKMV